MPKNKIMQYKKQIIYSDFIGLFEHLQIFFEKRRKMQKFYGKCKIKFEMKRTHNLLASL